MLRGESHNMQKTLTLSQTRALSRRCVARTASFMGYLLTTAQSLLLHAACVLAYFLFTYVLRIRPGKTPSFFWRPQSLTINVATGPLMTEGSSGANTMHRDDDVSSNGLTRVVKLRPICLRWGDVVLVTAPINGIQTIRGAITGAVLFGSVALQLMFITGYFSGSYWTPHYVSAGSSFADGAGYSGGLLVNTVGTSGSSLNGTALPYEILETPDYIAVAIVMYSVAATLFFAQMLRMVYHLNYLVMVLPRREKQHDATSAGAVAGAAVTEGTAARDVTTITSQHEAAAREEMEAEALGLEISVEEHVANELERASQLAAVGKATTQMDSKKNVSVEGIDEETEAEVAAVTHVGSFAEPMRWPATSFALTASTTVAHPFPSEPPRLSASGSKDELQPDDVVLSDVRDGHGNERSDEEAALPPSRIHTEHRGAEHEASTVSSRLRSKSVILPPLARRNEAHDTAAHVTTHSVRSVSGGGAAVRRHSSFDSLRGALSGVDNIEKPSTPSTNRPALPKVRLSEIALANILIPPPGSAPSSDGAPRCLPLPHPLAALTPISTEATLNPQQPDPSALLIAATAHIVATAASGAHVAASPLPAAAAMGGGVGLPQTASSPSTADVQRTPSGGKSSGASPATNQHRSPADVLNSAAAAASVAVAVASPAATKLFAHVRVEEELSYQLHGARIGEVVGLMSFNYSIGIRLLMWICCLLIGMLDDDSLIVSSLVMLPVLYYMDASCT